MNSKIDTLLKDLIIISSEKEDQINFIGKGFVGTEMLINFDISNVNRNDFLKHKLITESQKEALDKFHIYIQDDDLNDDLESEKWKETRLIAKEILKILNADHLGVYLDKTGKFWEAKLIK